MDILYECEYVLDRKKYLAWGRENQNSPLKRGFTAFWFIFAAVVFAAAIYYEFYSLFIFCLLALYRGLFHWRLLTARQYSLLARGYGTENWTRRISFGEDNIVMSEGNVSVNTSCSELTEVEEKGNYIKLHLKNGNVIRLYSDCFVKGTWEECKAHLLRQINANRAGVFTE